MQITAPEPEHIRSVADFLEWAAQLFAQQDLYFGHGTDNPWDEAVMLVLFVLKLPAENDRSILERTLNIEQKKQLISLAINRVSSRIPVPYLTNEAWFAGERYYVTKDVLIPRSPLVETIAHKFQPWLGANKQPTKILDLCTGSGCLAILCAKYFPEAQIDATDISEAALAVAKRNRELHGCIDRVNLIYADLFNGLAKNTYDIIVSNPPYVGQQEMQALPTEYKHEPSLALESGIDGLDLTRIILQQAGNYLTAHGLLFVEVGTSWQTLADKYPHIPFTWLEFANGGEGVFMLSADQLHTLKLENNNGR